MGLPLALPPLLGGVSGSTPPLMMPWALGYSVLLVIRDSTGNESILEIKDGTFRS